MLVVHRLLFVPQTDRSHTSTFGALRLSCARQLAHSNIREVQEGVHDSAVSRYISRRLGIE